MPGALARASVSRTSCGPIFEALERQVAFLLRTLNPTRLGYSVLQRWPSTTYVRTTGQASTVPSRCSTRGSQGRYKCTASGPFRTKDHACMEPDRYLLSVLAFTTLSGPHLYLPSYFTLVGNRWGRPTTPSKTRYLSHKRSIEYRCKE